MIDGKQVLQKTVEIPAKLTSFFSYFSVLNLMAVNLIRLKRGWYIRPKPENRINKKHMAEYYCQRIDK